MSKTNRERSDILQRALFLWSSDPANPLPVWASGTDANVAKIEDGGRCDEIMFQYRRGERVLSFDISDEGFWFYKWTVPEYMPFMVEFAEEQGHVKSVEQLHEVLGWLLAAPVEAR